MNDRKNNTIRQVAIWVDHNKAYLAKFQNDHLTREEQIDSNAGPRTHGGGWSQHRFEAHRHEQLKHYYEEIVSHLGSVDQILILGPGLAKHELRANIEHHKGLRGKVVHLKASDKITEEQFIVEAEQYFNMV
jgi:hypothetical protein